MPVASKYICLSKFKLIRPGVLTAEYDDLLPNIGDQPTVERITIKSHKTGVTNQFKHREGSPYYDGDVLTHLVFEPIDKECPVKEVKIFTTKKEE